MTNAGEAANSGTTQQTSQHDGLETQILRSAGWVALGFGSRQLITWLTMLLLVRLLEPSAFGTVAVALTIVTALAFLRGSGIWAALVHRRGDIDEAAASAFVYLVVSSMVVYGACFASAPLLASLFRIPELTDVLRVLALVIVFAGLSIVPGAYLARELRYAAVARLDLGAGIAQLTASVSLALAGAGVWSLVVGQIAAEAFVAVAIWHATSWRPSRHVSWAALRELSQYGRFAGGANIATFLSGIVDTLIVGRILGATAVGFYSVGFRVATVSESIVGYLLVKAMFPAFSIVQENREVFRRIFVQHAQRVALLVLPAAVFVALAAEPITLALLGESWSPVITPIRILAVFGFVRALSGTATTVFRGAGRPELAMWFAVANLALLIPALTWLTRSYGLDGAAIAVLVCTSVTTLPALAWTIRLVDIRASALLRTLAPSLVCAGVLTLVLGLLVVATASARPAIALVVLLVGGGLAYCMSIALFARSVVVPMWFDVRGTRTGP